MIIVDACFVPFVYLFTVIGIAFVPKKNENRITKAIEGLHYGIALVSKDEA